MHRLRGKGTGRCGPSASPRRNSSGRGRRASSRVSRGGVKNSGASALQTTARAHFKRCWLSPPRCRDQQDLVDDAVQMHTWMTRLDTPLHVAALQAPHGGDRGAPGDRRVGGEAQAVKKLAPLHAAARGGHPEAINLLLAAGADMNAQAEVEYTPLHAAATGGHTEAIKALLAAGASVDAREGRRKATPLHVAAAGGHAEAIKALVMAGASVDEQGDHRATALHLAAAGGYTEAVKALLAAGASVNAREDRRQATPLHLAAAGGHRGNQGARGGRRVGRQAG